MSVLQILKPISKYKRYRKQCPCGTNFMAKVDTRKYCTRDCTIKYQIKKPITKKVTLVCASDICNNEFQLWKSDITYRLGRNKTDKKLYCSRQCSGHARLGISTTTNSINNNKTTHIGNKKPRESPYKDKYRCNVCCSFWPISKILDKQWCGVCKDRTYKVRFKPRGNSKNKVYI